MEFGILGPLVVREGDRTVEIRAGHPRALLIALVLRAGRDVSDDYLMEVLWGEDLPRNPANALQTQISYLRRQLDGATGRPDSVVGRRAGRYVLDVDPEQVDATRFEALFGSARQLAAAGTAASVAAAVDELSAALALWRGSALADVAGAHFAMAEAARLEELRLAAVETRIEALLALGRHREVVGELGQLVADYALRERLHALLMLGLYRCDRQAEALRVYEAARRTLNEELGLDPGPALVDLQRQILAQDASLAWEPLPGWDAAAAPATRGADAVVGRPAGGTLPAATSAIIGRDNELARLQDLVGRARAVTATGPGGAGKSRLVLELARRQASDQQVWYADLGSVGRHDDVAAAVASAMGVPMPPGADGVAEVAGALSTQAGLLVLDTCEHVVDGAALLAASVLRQCPDVRILATSRRPLGIDGEVAWPVPPLDAPSGELTAAADVERFTAVQLFVERARAVHPAFTLTDANAGDVGAVCAALDGLPLAIELAAARAEVLSPAAIRARLDDRFGLLVDGRRDAAGRQQTLRAAIDWSYGLLDEDERRLLRRLSIFVGGFELEAAMAVAGEGIADPLRALAGLARHSMIAVVGEDRYRLLDTVRAYAAHALAAAGETDLIAERHSRYYADWIGDAAHSAIRTPAQLAWLPRLRNDIHNLKAAIEWAFSHGADELGGRLAGAVAWFWTLEGALADALAVLERAERSPHLSDQTRASVKLGIGLVAAPLGRLEDARVACEAAADYAQAAGSTYTRADALITLGVARWGLGDLTGAAAAHDEAVKLFDEAGEPWGRTIALVLRARTALDQDDRALARSLADQAVPAARHLGDHHVLGMALEQLARLAHLEGQHDEAVRWATECLAAHETVGSPEGTVAALQLLGRVRLAQGQMGTASALHRRALDLANRIGHPSARCEAVEAMAAIAAAAGDAESALTALLVADREREQRQLPRRTSDRAGHDALLRDLRAHIGPAAEGLAAKSTALSLDDVLAQLA